MKIYLAGKITKNGWRRHLVDGLEGVMQEDWIKVKSLNMITGDEYVGPFFVACDHGCSHGDNTHGADGSCMCDGRDITDKQVLAKATAGIKACDLFIVWVDGDFQSAYGTIAEIGMAHALGKPIVVVRGANLPENTASHAWFSLTCADMVLEGVEPATTIERVLLMLGSLKVQRGEMKGILRSIHQFYESCLARAVDFENRCRSRQCQTDIENLERLQKASKPVLAIPSVITKTNAGAYDIETTVSVVEKPAEDWKN